jgi:hypothetical protein
MLVRWRRLGLCLTLPALLATACSAGDAGPETSADEINYRSAVGQEFTLSAKVIFDAPASATTLEGEERQKAIVAHAEALRTTVTSAIGTELERIWPKEERLRRGAGVVVQLRQGSASYTDLTPVPDADQAKARFAMVVSGDFAGVKDLETKLPLRTEGGETFLPVSVDLGAGSEELRVAITPVERSRNAYPKYLELFEDGLDIGVHVGGDHNTPPKDIDHARSIYEDLVASGFRSPVASFEELAIDSAPFTKAVHVRGEEVEVRIRLFHPDLTTPETRQGLVDAYQASMKNADVIIYDGHAGRRLDYSGVVLAYQPARVSIPANAFKDIESTDKQQVYLFNGCETYTGYADKLYENPKKTPENTDVITTANYSAIFKRADQVLAFIHALVDEKSGAWIPRSWDSILGRMDAVGARAWTHVYGVHGLDDDPRVSPLADVSMVGVECAADADCKAPDSACLVASANRKVCGVACADSAGCPDGTQCVLPSGTTSLDAMQCAAP